MLQRTKPFIRFRASLGRFTDTVSQLKENPMFKNLIAAWSLRMANRRTYNRLIAEIEQLNARDLADLRADPIEMRRHAWMSVYGQSRA